MSDFISRFITNASPCHYDGAISTWREILLTATVISRKDTFYDEVGRRYFYHVAIKTNPTMDTEQMPKCLQSRTGDRLVIDYI